MRKLIPIVMAFVIALNPMFVSTASANANCGHPAAQLTANIKKTKQTVEDAQLAQEVERMKETDTNLSALVCIDMLMNGMGLSFPNVAAILNAIRNAVIGAVCNMAMNKVNEAKNMISSQLYKNVNVALPGGMGSVNTCLGLNMGVGATGFTGSGGSGCKVANLGGGGNVSLGTNGITGSTSGTMQSPINTIINGQSPIKVY